MSYSRRLLASSGLVLALIQNAWAGGSGLNVAVVVNQNSTNSIQLGNYYCEQRGVPPQNVLRINWTGGSIEWTTTDYATSLLNPLLAMLSARQLTNQIEYVVLSMDIPYRVDAGTNGANSTTSSLFYGFKPDTNSLDDCPIALGSTNFYAGSEGIFRSTPPISATSNSFLVTMITSSNLALAKQVVNSGVLGDSTFPTQTVFLAKSTDTARNVRYISADNAVINASLRGNYSIQRTNASVNWIFGSALGLQNGVNFSTPDGTAFLPGSMADNLTSFGGQIFQDPGQLKLLEFLTAGASGSFGTVVEPCSYLEKFPSPQNYFYQARGFSLAECYYQSLTNPYQGLLVGEPLTAPFAYHGSGSVGLTPGALLGGTTNVMVVFNSYDNLHPLTQIDVFLDGLWVQTITNIGPTRSNLLNVTINGQSMNYLVPLNAKIKSVTSNLVAMINTSANTNVTKVLAFAHGDRIELQSFDRSKVGAQVSVSTSNSIGAGISQTTWVVASRSNCLDTIANGLRTFLIKGYPSNGTFLQLAVTQTNGIQSTFGVTNSSGLTLEQMTQRLIDLINTNNSPSLQGPDGLIGEDFVTGTINMVPAAEFNFRARSIGWDAAQIQVDINGSTNFVILPGNAVKLDQNLGDLEPRNHLYVIAGVTNLAATFALNTTTQANGFHQLTAVAYEGNHVRTQTKASQSVEIRNGTLAATFSTLVGDTNTAVGGTLQFSVVANTNTISKIELFSTGGALTNVSVQSTAVFSVAGLYLGVGLHPFYAIVTANDGKQYRTETQWIRLIESVNTPFSLSISAPPVRLSWPALAGRQYDILSTTNIGEVFAVQATITASNSTPQWIDTNGPSVQRFYRVRTAD